MDEHEHPELAQALTRIADLLEGKKRRGLDDFTPAEQELIRRGDGPFVPGWIHRNC